MKKKALLLASMGALVCTVGVTALAVGGANHLDAFAVKAGSTEYSVTFNESNTTVEANGKYYAICTTTPRGAKVGVLGGPTNIQKITFNNVSFMRLFLIDYKSVLNGVGAFEFSHITGFAISFSGGSMKFDGGDTLIDSVTSGAEYTGLSITPSHPSFFDVSSGSVTITSLTIWYSC